MKTVLTRIFSTICLLLFSYYNILGQTVSNNIIVRETLDEMFELLDKSKVPTGYLLDYAVDIVDFGKYDGLHLTDSNYVTPSGFCDIVTSIKSASVVTSSIGDVSQIMTDLHAGGDESFMKDFYLTLCNTEQEPLQDIPFVIVYKSVFPEN